MAYSINGIEFPIQPTSGKWVNPRPLGVTGNGHPVYPALKSFQLKWNLLSPSGTYMLQNFINTSITGTVVVDLPKYNYYEYSFFSYTGCVVNEMSFGNYFSENLSNITLLITNIQT